MTEFFEGFPTDGLEGDPDYEIIDELPWATSEPKDIVKGPFLVETDGEEKLVFLGIDENDNPVKILMR